MPEFGPRGAPRPALDEQERRGRDSNPRGSYKPPTRFPVALLKPLGHLSGHGQRRVQRRSRLAYQWGPAAPDELVPDFAVVRDSTPATPAMNATKKEKKSGLEMITAKL
jgi:hypothetical protein